MMIRRVSHYESSLKVEGKSPYEQRDRGERIWNRSEREIRQIYIEKFSMITSSLKEDGMLREQHVALANKVLSTS